MAEIKIGLGGTEYTVPALNLGQLERVSVLAIEGSVGSGFAMLKIALERALPKPDFEQMAPTIDEVGNAVQAILKLSGLQKPDANPPVAASPEPPKAA